MSRDVLLDLFVAAATKPHRQCLHRIRTAVTLQRRQAIRFASTTPSPNSKPDTDPDIPSSSPRRRPLPPPTPLAAAAKVPLHVGLDRNPENRSAISRIPIPKGVKGENFTPSVLSHPLGLSYPPRPGQNSPIDRRSLSEKKKDFSSYDKVLEKRQIYLRSFLRPYFQEWKRFEHHKGKSFVANERLFRADKAQYFPNIWGETLAEEGDGPDGGRDTTNVLMGKISVVAVKSNQWAAEQVDSFIGKEKNPELQTILDGNSRLAQRVDLNIQGDWARLQFVRLFKSGLRKDIPKERWNKYFILKLPRDVRKGLTDDVRDAMGLLNSQVGYVYLLDQQCKIRWAGSAHAWDGEVASLNTGIKKLLQEASGATQSSRPLKSTSASTASKIPATRSPPTAIPA